MSSPKRHLELANRHQATLEVLLQDSAEHPEWVTVISFYKALQVVDACLSVLGVGLPFTHGERKRMLVKSRRMDKIWSHYRDLKNASSVARYLAGDRGNRYESFNAYLAEGKAEGVLVRHRLAQIEKSARKILDRHGDLLHPAVPA